jgi:hypothetical protein
MTFFLEASIFSHPLSCKKLNQPPLEMWTRSTSSPPKWIQCISWLFSLPSMVWFNWILASTNLLVIPLFLYDIKDQQGIYYIFYTTPMFISILYQLSITRHELPGVYPFNLYHLHLLWASRVSLVITLYMAWNQGAHHKLFQSFHLILIAWIALVNLVLSERDNIYYHVAEKLSVQYNKFLLPVSIWSQIDALDFVITQCTWNILAIVLLSLTT